MEMTLFEDPQIAAGAFPSEAVERKGLGHPDTICDALAEQLSLALCRSYHERCGRVLHHNVDKALLWGGQSRPAFGGGEVLRPMEIYLAGRATAEFQGIHFPIEDLAREECRGWFGRTFHALDLEKHVVLKNLIRPGSADLVDLFSRQFESGALLANDTSCGVGHAPFSLLEDLVYRVERFITSREHIAQHPEIGEDVKVMGIRRDSQVRLIVACAFVDRFIPDLDAYLDRKDALAARIREFAAKLTGAEIGVEVNSADEPRNGSVYLTVTGTSAECGDDGEAGRGNRVNGLITPCRAMTMESAAGKNPITHVGKLYNIAASRIAAALVTEVGGITDARCFLTSQIGRPIRKPELTEIRYRRLRPGGAEPDKRRIRQVVRRELDGIGNYWRELVDGRLGIDRWPVVTG
jgi:S-adenosylmethionine synthetase